VLLIGHFGSCLFILTREIKPLKLDDGFHDLIGGRFKWKRTLTPLAKGGKPLNSRNENRSQQKTTDISPC